MNNTTQLGLLILLIAVLVYFFYTTREGYHTGQQHSPLTRFSSVQYAPLNHPSLYGQFMF